jgi:hypothetical protein
VQAGTGMKERGWNLGSGRLAPGWCGTGGMFAVEPVGDAAAAFNQQGAKRQAASLDLGISLGQPRAFLLLFLF